MKDFIRFLIVFLASSVSNKITLNEPAVEQKESVLSAMIPLLEADAAIVQLLGGMSDEGVTMRADAGGHFAAEFPLKSVHLKLSGANEN